MNISGWIVAVFILTVGATALIPGIVRLFLFGCAEIVEAYYKMRERIKNAPQKAQEEYAEKG